VGQGNKNCPGSCQGVKEEKIMELLKQMGPVSVSRLQKYERCPHAWYQRYILKNKEASSDAADFGKLVHAIIAEAIQRETSEGEIEDLLIDVMAGEIQFVQEDNIAELWIQFAERKDEIIKMVAKALSLSGNGKTENYFCLPLPCGVEMQGYIDYIDDVSLIDWKTGGNVKGALSSQQIPIYKWAAAQLENRPPETYEGKYVFLGQENGVYTDSHSIDKALEWADNLCRQINDALEAYEIIGEEAFPPMPGPACKYCGFEDCPKRKTQFTLPEEISDREEARDVAAYILQLEIQLEKAKSLMKDFCQNNGPVEVNGEWFGMFPGTPKREWDKFGLYELLKNSTDTDEDWLKVFNVDTRAITALLKKQPELEEKINELVKEKPGSKVFKHQQTAPAV